jgi:DNA repair protein RAD50
MLKNTMRDIQQELSAQKFSNIEKVMLDLNVKFCLTRDISLEVQEKHDALEESLMRYHHEKMKEINSTLADFWKLTYKGNDIDTIEIKSDVEKTATNQRMRSYNYRIVLRTPDDTELDMRGRCSAG